MNSLRFPLQYENTLPMPKLELPNVTLFCADCLDVNRAIKVIEKCKSLCNFGAVKLCTSLETDYVHKVPIMHLPTLVAYSIFMLKKFPELVETDYVLTVQHDGWVLNTSAWNPAWLGYDYIGPLFIHRHIINARSVGSGGFSFRSRKLINAVSEKLPAWDGTVDGANIIQNQVGCWEDGVISLLLRDHLERAGFKYAPPLEASKFAQGGNCDEGHYVKNPFGFHGLWTNINHDTGLVDPWPQDANY